MKLLCVDFTIKLLAQRNIYKNIYNFTLLTSFRNKNMYTVWLIRTHLKIALDVNVYNQLSLFVDYIVFLLF